jgi:hypothetical protein
MPQDVPITNPLEISAVYSNHFGVSATMSDFTIYFLELGQTPGPKGIIHKQEVKAIVTLPIMAAGGMIQVLQQILQAHANQVEEAQKKLNIGQQ